MRGHQFPPTHSNTSSIRGDDQPKFVFAFMRAVNPLALSKDVHFALHSSLISSSLEPLSAPHLQCRVQMSGLWAKATIFAASLFGQSVDGWTCSSQGPAFFECRRNTVSISGASLNAFAQVPGLAFAATKGVCNLETTALRSGSWHPACSLQSNRTLFENVDELSASRR